MNDAPNHFYKGLKRGVPCYKHIYGINDKYVYRINNRTVLDITFETDERRGITIPELLTIAYFRLNKQNKEKPSRKVSLALTKIEEAILWLASAEEDK